jgi:hypothetical protein
LVVWGGFALLFSFFQFLWRYVYINLKAVDKRLKGAFVFERAELAFLGVFG